jgi:hypothetical protein
MTEVGSLLRDGSGVSALDNGRPVSHAPTVCQPEPEPEPEPEPAPEPEPEPEPEPALLRMEQQDPCAGSAARRVEALALLGMHEGSGADEIARAAKKLSHKLRKDAVRFAEVAAAASVLQCEHAVAKRPKLTVAREEWAAMETPDSAARLSSVRVGEPGATPKTVREFGAPPELFSLDGPPPPPPPQAMELGAQSGRTNTELYSDRAEAC